MRFYDIILKKREGKVPLTKEEINFFVTGYTDGTVKDYQASALLMAIMFNGLNKEETAQLTLAMANSGDMINLNDIKGIKVDKHSTGGVGDKVSIVVCPIVAALGVPVAKMSGRGLGHTGGTVDKLQSIPGYITEINTNNFIKQVQDIGISIIGQTGNIAPADKKIYSLRDVTATVDDISLIAASIMSKKLASGADAFVLDIKVGNGAFAKTQDWARKLADVMVQIAQENGKKASAILTNMDQPLGNAVGNWLEIVEVIQALQGNAPNDLMQICKEVATTMLVLAEKGTKEECLKMVQQVIDNGSALNKFKEMVKAQGGDIQFINNPNKIYDYYTYKMHNIFCNAQKTGYIQSMDTYTLGTVSVMLGAGRATKDDIVNPLAGIIFNSKIGDKVSKGDTIATLYTSQNNISKEVEQMVSKAITIGTSKVEPIPSILS